MNFDKIFWISQKGNEKKMASRSRRTCKSLPIVEEPICIIEMDEEVDDVKENSVSQMSRQNSFLKEEIEKEKGDDSHDNVLPGVVPKVVTIQIESVASSSEQLPKQTLENSQNLFGNDSDSDEGSIENFLQLSPASQEVPIPEFVPNCLSTMMVKPQEEKVYVIQGSVDPDDENTTNTKTEETIITRNGKLIYLEPISDPPDVTKQPKKKRDIETNFYEVTLSILFFIALILSEILSRIGGVTFYIYGGIMAITSLSFMTYERIIKKAKILRLIQINELEHYNKILTHQFFTFPWMR